MCSDTIIGFIAAEWSRSAVMNEAAVEMDELKRFALFVQGIQGECL